MPGRSGGKLERSGPDGRKGDDSGSREGNREGDEDPEWIEGVRRALMEWNDDFHRVLPWRRERDPYRILVSEMMLVQTTVAAVIPYFERFLARFPDPQTLASAPEAEVLKVWEGLGYYRRARHLQAAARLIVERHGGKFPSDPQSVRDLPGVGRYMAGAILSFAFDLPEPIVEANSQRVLARLLAWRGDLKASSSQARLWEAAARLVPPRGAGKFNQALMDLGALICTPRQPSCLLCPLAGQCAARRLGLQDVIPVTTPKPPPLAVSEACAVVVRAGRVLMVQRGEGGLWSGFWEFPTIHAGGADPAGRAFDQDVSLAEGLVRLTGIRAETGRELKTVAYSVTKYRVELRAYLARALSGRLKPAPAFASARWVEPAALPDLTMGSGPRRLAGWINQDPRHLDWS